MNTETASKQIVKLRKRLKEIDKEREALPEDAFGERADLVDEEHEIHARIGELQDSFTQTENEITEELKSIDPRTPPQQPIL